MEILSLPIVKRTVERTLSLWGDVKSNLTEQFSNRVQNGRWAGFPLARTEPEAPARPALLDVPNEELSALSRAELYELATLLDVRGRKNMRKVQLIASIEQARLAA